MGFVLGYPEILLAVICFVSLHYLSSGSPHRLPTNWPFVGMLPSLLINANRVHDWTTQLLARSGCTFVFKGPWFTNLNIVGTCDPANVHYILSTNFSNFERGYELKEIFDVLGDGIFNSDSDLWRKQRKISHMFVNHPRFRQFSDKTSREKVENGLIPVIEYVVKQGSVVDLQDVFQRFTFDSTYILISGMDPRSLSIQFPKVPFAEALDDAEEVIFHRDSRPKSYWKFQRWLQIGKERKMARAWKTLDQLIGDCITKKREQLRTKPKEEENSGLLTSLMKEQDVDSKSDKFLRDAIINFMIAGRDTVSAGLTWFFYLVSKNPLVETKIIEELKVNISSKGRKLLDAEEVRGLVYLHGALCESLRLYPPVPIQHKTPLRRDVLPSGHIVDSKTKIFISSYAMARMEDIWGKDCLEFKPERWISENGGIKFEPSYKFLAFNAGPRTCLGKEVAFTQMKLVVATLIYNYQFQVVEGHPVSPKMSVILHMKHGLMARVQRRLVI
ncbi:hypothetical protein GIB67_015900 [Kingdonia uniflora]|uniref:Cytochrome P450 n=1 Tax=Kingdonia uniflora TaxID=39325 RepID=A0A7J7P7U3_9MAGN|nr:hypothetical protein GIB67_015899 [Kingdonia uniflora]KAF6175215.1 hypothetical protein GIB67_015900 [Kingdonia uniflora]